MPKLFISVLKITGRKRPALVDPSHSTSGSLPVHLGPIDGHMRCPIIQFSKKKMNFAKFADIHTYGHTDGEKSDYERFLSRIRSGSKKRTLVKHNMNLSCS